MRQPVGGKTKRMKQTPQGSEAEETLCCCEYLDRTGERSHLAACLCECEDLDEGCERINTCVGEQNHLAFILALCLFLITSVYGISLTLDTICREKSTIKALFHCPGVYGDYSSALSFTCVWYCAIVTSGMAYILLIQFFNISYNVTEREARIALRENIGRRLLCGLVVDTGQYNRGFLRNWIHFLTLRSAVLHHSDEDIV